MEYFVQPTQRFEKELRKLVRKYPEATEDLDPYLTELEKGNLLGDPIPGLKLQGNKVFKLRIPNSSANKGLPGGFRVIYYCVTSDFEVYLLSMYSKSDKQDISKKEIIDIINSNVY